MAIYGLIAWILLAGETGALLAGLFLWIPIGNGFRFGRWYLHYAQGLALAGLTLAFFLSDFWRQHYTVAAAIGGAAAAGRQARGHPRATRR